MLDRLRSRIRDLVAIEAARLSPRLARTFVLVASPGLAGLRELHPRLFPTRSGKAARLTPWVVANGDPAALSGECERALAAAFDAGTSHDLTLEGFQILDAANQLLLLADLSDEGGAAELEAALQAFDSARARLGSPSFPTVGIFFLKRPVAPSGGAGAPSYRVAGSDEFEHVAGVARDRLDRAFFLGAVNPQGTLLVAGEDLDSLALHLVHLLDHELRSAETPGQYFEWLRRGGAREYATGASGFSVALPADAIVETVAARRAASLIEDSLLQEPAKGRADDFARAFLTANQLATLRDALGSLASAPDLRPVDPLAGIPDLFAPGTRGPDLIATLDALDASLPRHAEENEVFYAIIAQRRATAWQVSVEDHLEELIGSEPGGLRAAPPFVAALNEHLEGELRVEPGVPSYPEPGPLTRALERLLEKAPAPATVWLRAALAGLGASGAILATPTGRGEQAAGVGAALLLSAGLAAFVNHAWRERLDRKARAVEAALREKWRALTSGSLRRLLRERCEELRAHLRVADKELGNALVRVPELVAHWRDRHAAPEPFETACYKPILRERGEMAAFESRCHPRAERVIDDYLESDSPLRLWRRLAPPGTEEPNGWETSLFEEAALRVLPDCEPIAGVGVTEVLDPSSPRFAALRQSLVRGAQPFLVLRPEARSGVLSAVLEGPEPGSSAPVAAILRAVESSFDQVRQLPPTSPHRISFFGLLEEAGYDDIVLR